MSVISTYERKVCIREQSVLHIGERMKMGIIFRADVGVVSVAQTGLHIDFVYFLWYSREMSAGLRVRIAGQNNYVPFCVCGWE